MSVYTPLLFDNLNILSLRVCFILHKLTISPQEEELRKAILVVLANKQVLFEIDNAFSMKMDSISLSSIFLSFTYVQSLPKVLEDLHCFLTHRANSSTPPPPQNSIELNRDYS